jgi:hypothetical protein
MTLQRRSQDAEEGLATLWQFGGETLLIKPHGAGHRWRCILRSPRLHAAIGLHKLTHFDTKARLSSAFR